ncbi:hypothetical protein [Pelobacter seleniigenes]|uniref:hypothetical protein n=1 Tax=Pelobacter seleniigenes TaxID=407188 RepID=UPI0004A6D69D|nr:hypothetical protein [Pelobacter seleniigenes]
MKRKKFYRLAAVGVAIIVAGLFMFCDLGLGFSPIMKFFVVFFGLIIGLQCIPAVLMFIGMLKGIAPQTRTKVIDHSGR